MKYPFDTDHLRKGDVVPGDFIAERFGVERGTDPFRRALLQSREHLKREFRRRGEVVEIKERKGDLLILTTDEAAEYTQQRHRYGIRHALEAQMRKLALPRDDMSPPVLDIHDRELINNGRVISAIKEARKGRTIAIMRQTPKQLNEKGTK